MFKCVIYQTTNLNSNKLDLKFKQIPLIAMNICYLAVIVTHLFYTTR